jgi:hypothetical protein
VTKHHNEARVEAGSRKLDTADLGGCDNVAGHANDEEVAEALIEDQLRRYAGVGAAEDDGEGLLGGAEDGVAPAIEACDGQRQPLRKALVPNTKSFKCL